MQVANIGRSVSMLWRDYPLVSSRATSSFGRPVLSSNLHIAFYELGVWNQSRSWHGLRRQTLPQPRCRDSRRLMEWDTGFAGASNPSLSRSGEARPQSARSGWGCCHPTPGTRASPILCISSSRRAFPGRTLMSSDAVYEEDGGFWVTKRPGMAATSERRFEGLGPNASILETSHCQKTSMSAALSLSSSGRAVRTIEPDFIAMTRSEILKASRTFCSTSRIERPSSF